MDYRDKYHELKQQYRDDIGKLTTQNINLFSQIRTVESTKGHQRKPSWTELKELKTNNMKLVMYDKLHLLAAKKGAFEGDTPTADAV